MIEKTYFIDRPTDEAMPLAPAPPATANLVAWLHRAAREPDRCDFAALLALAERALGAAPLDTFDARPRVLLRSARRLGHIPAVVTEVAPPARPGDPWVVTSSLLGLAGPGTPLPLGLAASLARSHPHAPLLTAVEHTLLALLFRSQHALHLDRGWLDRCLALAALERLTPLAGPRAAAPSPASASPPHHPAPDARPILLAIRLQGPCTARALVVALRAALAPHLDRIDVSCDDLEPAWLDLDPPPRLGWDGARLGVGLALGGRVRACGERLRLRVGPLRVGPHRAFLPGGDAHTRLLTVLRVLLPRPWPIDLILTLRDPDATPAALGSARLGDDAWLGRRRPGVRDTLTIDIPA